MQQLTGENYSTELPVAHYLARRSRPLNRQPIVRQRTDYVLCWLQQSLRGHDNPVIDAALAFARLTGQPVVVYHGLGQRYPHASDRLHRFILEASRSLEAELLQRGLRFIRHVDTESTVEPGLVYRLASRASVVVLDDQSAYVGRWQAQRVASRLDRLVVAVDAARLVPELALGGRFLTTPAFRARHTELRETWLDEPADLAPTLSPFDGELAVDSTELGTAGSGAIDELIARCAIDHTLKPVDWCCGDRARALQHLVWVAGERIDGYAATRNNPALERTTYLSPYLHFGVLSPREVAALVGESRASSRDQWRFLDEQLTWREYFHHHAHHQCDPSAYENLPERARSTLDLHRADPREVIHDLETPIQGDTADEIWNVAQRQFLLDGWMHNNLRMYWGKRLLEWTETPEAAWITACYLNDRFSLDGRDPATYGNLRWCFGESRPSRETPIFGTVPRKSDRALRARPGFHAWCTEQLARKRPHVQVPSRPTLISRPQASGSAPLQILPG